MNHKNLEYFSTSKVLTWAKPDSLTQCWDIYPKEVDKDYAHINPQNLCPVFTQEQLALSLWATILMAPVLHASSLLNIEDIHKDTLEFLSSGPITSLQIKDLSDS
ncbi:hypothetical protein PAXRUDRAFT_17323 [Paxillus rubicundulus Ve08.2h10]|uniref:Unplaced genomic scaffold scaffold_2049, whole genome shotgun sequence n=1 Tax=Paxillus rubicundulus Ve08.2h10 TaxID=930991 RepID=A0A0D0DAV3_9AGAM|nr:hypothetical protein PAXRUDRAFT_17323 [Paxillus rubicundulus Ve08.2h10]